MPEGTFGGDLIGITGWGKEGRKLPTTGMFFTHCVMYIHSLIGFAGYFFLVPLHCRIFFQSVPCINFFLFVFGLSPPSLF